MKFSRPKKDRTDLNNETFNVVESISKAKDLYKSLIIRSHPDKHPRDTDLATELTRLVNANKFNYRELLNIEKRIVKELKEKK